MDGKKRGLCLVAPLEFPSPPVKPRLIHTLGPAERPDRQTTPLPSSQNQPPVRLPAVARFRHSAHGSPPFGHAAIVAWAARRGAPDAHIVTWPARWGSADARSVPGTRGTEGGRSARPQGGLGGRSGPGRGRLPIMPVTEPSGISRDSSEPKSRWSRFELGPVAVAVRWIDIPG